jgi:hypothetical protein
VTRAETSEVLAMIGLHWPHSNLGENPVQVLDFWHAQLGDLPADAVAEALTDLSREGREHAPPVGVVFNRAVRGLHELPPSFEDMLLFFSRHHRCFPYRDGHNQPEDTVACIEALTEAGAHEAVLRFVAEQGVYAVRTIPDGSMHPLDMNQQADRRDKARHYEHRTVPAWRADPRPGLALAQASRVLERGAGPRKLDVLGALGLPAGAEE